MTNPNGAPSIPEGYIVIVDPDLEAYNGDFVVAKLEGYEEAVLKKLDVDGPHVYLNSLHPHYESIKCDENCKIVGVVKRVEFELRK